MRILYFSSRECWPPNTGARLRDYHLASQLARHARVTYFGLRPPHDPPPVPVPVEAGFEEALLTDKDRQFAPANLLRGLLGPLPVTVLNNTSARIAAALREVLSHGDEFDTVQIEGVHLTGYLPLLRSSRGKPALIGDWHNIESEIMRRYSVNNGNPLKRIYAGRTAGLIEDSELRLIAGCDVSVTTSDREREKLLARSPEARIEVVGNGVDTEFFSNVAKSEDRRDVLFVGSMDYHANIEGVEWFAKEMWPQISAQSKGLRFVIAGRNPAPEVRALESIPGVKVTGTVEDIRPWYGSALAVVVPLRTGSGTRLKILEAMAACVPVVSTRLGAEGIEVTDGRDILFAETADEMSEAILGLERNSGRRSALVAQGRALVERSYDWRSLGAKLFEIHERAAQR